MPLNDGISLEATPTVPLERRLSPPKNTPRRDFLSTIGRGILATAVATACKGDEIIGPEEEDPRLRISGEAIVHIDHWGGVGSAQYDNIGDFRDAVSWSVRRDNGGFGEIPVDLGQGTSASYDFKVAGKHTVKAEIEDEISPISLEFKVEVHQAQKPNSDYPLIAFLRHDNDVNASAGMQTTTNQAEAAAFPSPALHSGGPLRPSLHSGSALEAAASVAYEFCLMQPDDHSSINKLSSGRFFPRRLSFESGGRRIAFSKGVGDYGLDLMMFDFETGDITKIAPGDDRNSQERPSWDRSGRVWYLDNTRPPDYVELALVDPDGSSDPIYPAGSIPSLDFMCFYPSCSPDSNRIAAGGAYFFSSAHSQNVNRIRIFELSGSGESVTSMSNLNSEDDIRAFLSEHHPDAVEQYYGFFAEGVNGAAWSPDGQKIAWVTRYGLDPNPFQIMALMVRDAEGTGPIQVLDTAHYQQGSELLDPCWSPDSNYILYSKGNSPLDPGPKNSDIMMIAADGSGEPINLTNDGLNLHGGVTWGG